MLNTRIWTHSKTVALCSLNIFVWQVFHTKGLNIKIIEKESLAESKQSISYWSSKLFYFSYAYSISINMRIRETEAAMYYEAITFFQYPPLHVWLGNFYTKVGCTHCYAIIQKTKYIESLIPINRLLYSYDSVCCFVAINVGYNGNCPWENIFDTYQSYGKLILWWVMRAVSLNQWLEM